ncbi:MAG: hypothetical protein OES20_17320 [Gammaproteobacteria bacterium]|nr:hypothetical protein [Gammaproteobacteria bacterium]MDH3858137.1 hypothetical protein [Gammaproteobacteria bacterium]
MIIPTPEDDFPRLTADPADIIASVFSQDRRALLFGAPGTGKSTLVTRLAEQFAQLRRGCWCISADPGSPLMGVPGAVTLGHWQHDGWLTVEYFALCTLDAGRFRLPLVSTLRRLTEQFRDGVILVDGPGVARGVAGRELLEGLVEATRAEPRLHQELAVHQGVIREDAGFRIRAVFTGSSRHRGGGVCL